jgi:hypothetical protein
VENLHDHEGSDGEANERNTFEIVVNDDTDAHDCQSDGGAYEAAPVAVPPKSQVLPSTPAPKTVPAATTTASKKRSASVVLDKGKPKLEGVMPSRSRPPSKRRRGAQDLEDIESMVQADANSRTEIAKIKAEAETRRALLLRELELKDREAQRTLEREKLEYQRQQAQEDRAFRMQMFQMQQRGIMSYNGMSASVSY